MRSSYTWFLQHLSDYRACLNCGSWSTIKALTVLKSHINNQAKKIYAPVNHHDACLWNQHGRGWGRRTAARSRLDPFQNQNQINLKQIPLLKAIFYERSKAAVYLKQCKYGRHSHIQNQLTGMSIPWVRTWGFKKMKWVSELRARKCASVRTGWRDGSVG